MEISNKLLVMFIVVSIVVSVAGTMISLNKLNKFTVPTTTGHATSNTTGNVTLTVQTQGGLVFTQNLIAWGTGYVNTSNGNNRCNLTTWTQPNYATSACIGFTSNNVNLTMENQGNVPLQILVNISKNVTEFLGGTTPTFTIEVRNASTRPGCMNTLNTTVFNLDNSYAPGTQIEACNQLNYTDTIDRLDLIVNVTFANDVPQTSKTVTVEAQGTY